MDFFNLLFVNFETGLLIFARAIGIIAFNPILSRRNIPMRVKIGIAMLITFAVISAIQPAPADTGAIAGVYLVLVAKEAIVGLTLGFITDIFIYTVQVGGQLMDMQTGLGMANVFDPLSNSPSSVMGSIVSLLLYLYFFAVNGHLTVIALFASSYGIIPLTNWSLNPEIGMAVMTYFSMVFALVLKLSLPIVVAALVVQFGIGIMMKSVPQIQIMMVNIQVKIVFGFYVLFVIAVPLSEFIDRYLDMWLATLQDAIPLIPL